jgi:hypothetical protein
LRGPDDHPLRGELGRGRRFRGFGDPEIGHDHPPGGIEEDVVRLDIPVHDAVPVRMGQGLRDLPRHARGVRDREALLGLEQLADRGAVHAAHDDVEHLVLVAAHLVDRHDVRVLEPGDGARLAHEALRERRGGSEAEVDDLDRDVALERRVANAEHGGKATFAQEGADGKFVAQGPLQAFAERGEIQRPHGGRET